MKWIKCDNEMPFRNDHVLIRYMTESLHDPKVDMPMVTIAFYSADMDCWIRENGMCFIPKNKVIHWMPKPAYRDEDLDENVANRKEIK